MLISNTIRKMPNRHFKSVLRLHCRWMWACTCILLSW